MLQAPNPTRTPHRTHALQPQHQKHCNLHIYRTTRKQYKGTHREKDKLSEVLHPFQIFGGSEKCRIDDCLSLFGSTVDHLLEDSLSFLNQLSFLQPTGLNSFGRTILALKFEQLF